MKKLSLLFAPLVLTACAVTQDSIPVEPNGGIGDGITRPMLQLMSMDEANKTIGATLGCVFLADGNDAPILRSAGEDNADVKGTAVVKLNDTMVKLTHQGFGIAGVEKGGSFTTEALMIDLIRPTTAPELLDDDRYYWQATLNVTQDEGGNNSYKGRYICTP